MAVEPRKAPFRRGPRLLPWVLFAVAPFLLVRTAGAAATFSATLVGGEEIPPNTSTARGTGSATLNANDTLTYSVTSTGFATVFRAAHVHEGTLGVAGAILFRLNCNPEGTACSGTSPLLSVTQKAAVLAGRTYFDLHSDTFSGGEIRGQLTPMDLTPASVTTFVATLIGGEETPPNVSPARGTGSATLNVDDTLTYSVTATGFETPFRAAHVHEGALGVAGPILFEIDCSIDGTSCSGSSPPLGVAERTALVAGRAYFNLHTEAFPGGEIRGQLAPVELAPASDTTFLANLVGEEESPPNTSTARGTGSATLNADDTLTYSVAATGFETPFRAAHVHEGALGVAGPILFEIDCSIDGTSCNGTSPPLSAAQKAALLAGDSYINLHTDAFPDGEIRGQLLTASGSSAATDALVERFSGRAKHLAEVSGFGLLRGGADLILSGRFSVDGTLDLDTSTAVFEAILSETGGAGELVRGAFGGPALPIVLRLARYHPKRREATYRTAVDGLNPRCQVKITPRGKQAFDFALTCKRSAGATIPFPPMLCGAGSHPTTLMTRFVVNAGAPIVVSTSQPWECVRNQTRIRELRSVGNRKGSTGGNSPTGPGNRPPVASFGVHPRRGAAPLHVAFTNQSTDPDGHVTRFGWTFGDGSGSAKEHPTHTYTTPGEFVVTLVVTDDQGLASPLRREKIRVDRSRPSGGDPSPPGGEPPADGNRPPRADFRVSLRGGAAPLNVAFTNRSSDPDGDAITVSWDFGDGRRSTEQNPVHTYTSPGRFVATLMATDAHGTPGDRPKQETITVTGAAGEPPPPGTNHPPLIDFRASPRSGAWPLAVTFTNRSSDPDGDAMVFSWDFGDGTRTVAESPIHTYTRAGKFLVTLTATDARGASAAQPKQETITVTANRAPYADFRAEPRRGAAPLTVTFQNRSADPDGEAVTSRWSFGDGTATTQTNPTHTYTHAGTFVVTLTVTDAGGADTARPKLDTIQVEGEDTPGGGEPGCGDGTIDAGEECDPPNTTTCDAHCQLVQCGDRVVQRPAEECEPPNGPTCDATCHFIQCGNGVVQRPAEECDPPNGTTCDGRCQLIQCGDRVVQRPAEECDPPNGTTCDATCHLVQCGDGRLQPPEECEDSGDCGVNARCTAACTCECIGPEFASTYAAIQRLIFDSPVYQCSTASCHSGTFPAGGLNLTLGRSYVGLVGAASSATLLDRVERGDPEMSFLYLKLAARTLGEPLEPGEGSPMPLGSPQLTQAHLEAIRSLDSRRRPGPGGGRRDGGAARRLSAAAALSPRGISLRGALAVHRRRPQARGFQMTSLHHVPGLRRPVASTARQLRTIQVENGLRQPLYLGYRLGRSLLRRGENS